MLTNTYQWRGYPIIVGSGNKKYVAIVDGKRVPFGDSRYQQYHDKLGHWSSLDHNDPERRKRFRKRFAKSADAVGTAGWFSYHVLW